MKSLFTLFCSLGAFFPVFAKTVNINGPIQPPVNVYSPIAYWKMDGDGTDASGSGYDLSLAGGAGFAGGKFGSALDLPNDASKYATRPGDDNAFDFGGNDFTISLWVNFNSLTDEQVLIEKWDGCCGPGWTLTKKVGNELLLAGGDFNPQTAALPFTINNWHHVLVRKSGTDINFFLDGTVVGTFSGGPAFADNGKPLRIGERDGGQQFPVNGRMDDIAIWDFGLSNAEVASIWNGGAGTPIELICAPPVTCYADTDGDGYGDPGTPQNFAGSCGAGYVSDNTDCDDGDAAVNPGATEILCNNVDDDCNPGTPDEHPDYDALMALYNSTDGANWFNNTGWIDGAAGTDCNVDEWYGVTCDPPGSGRVVSLVLNNNNLSGPLPNEIGNLTELSGIDFQGNQITGSIPSSIGNLTKMEYLNLGGNLLSGSIPSSIGNLTNLKFLFMGSNQLSGMLPATMGNLANLQFMQFSSNQLSGPIPGSLGSLNNLTFIDLAFNHLSGCFDPNLANFCNVNYAFYENAGLHLNGNFAAFCANGAGGCGIDADGDGYSFPDDCDDTNPVLNPAAAEICDDGIDNNCNGEIDEPAVCDVDGDGFQTTSDCDDNNAAINPDAVEICDGLDNNCDGTTDEGCNDNDGDGYAVPADCDDNNPDINPGAAELCDGIDNDCDGSVDENAPLVITCPASVPALTADSNCRASIGDYTALATANGGCGAPLNPVTQVPAQGTVFNPGTVAIRLTVTNTDGQEATCVFNVTISGGCGN
ncbi:MAG: hypothetical protein JNJ90_06040 [Saprospiraceae bacterium]|jgi:hypothetical protein|nr:hypothetical protein [Saprospiraceae bacterium]